MSIPNPNHTHHFSECSRNDDQDTLCVELAHPTEPSIIKVIGVGGGGGNAVGNMYRHGIEGVNFLVCNTDSKALSDSPVPERLQLGPGLGVGGVPQVGRAIAEEHVEQISQVLDGNLEMLFITAGMGGGTGTGVSPVIAQEARKKGILTVAIVTIPFAFEMAKRIDMALDGVEVLAKHVDALLIINNERLKQIYSDLSVINAFKKADETLLQAVRSIVDIIKMHGHINMDFQDVRNCLKDGGVAIMASGYGKGEHRLTNAINNAIHSPLLNDNDVYKASRLLISITSSEQEEHTLATQELEIIQKFTAKFGKNVETKFGLDFDDSLGEQVKVTILASGFSLLDPRKFKKSSPKLMTEEEIQREERRERIYGSYETYKRPHYHYHVMQSQDLDNEALVSLMEQTPTYRRTRKDLDALKDLSKGQKDRTEI